MKRRSQSTYGLESIGMHICVFMGAVFMGAPRLNPTVDSQPVVRRGHGDAASAAVDHREEGDQAGPVHRVDLHRDEVHIALGVGVVEYLNHLER